MRRPFLSPASVPANVLIGCCACPLYFVQGTYASLGFARTPTDWRNLAIVIGTIGTALGANWMVKKVKASNKDRQRERAYKELTKDD